MSEVVALYPLSPSQQGMLFHALEDAALYVQQLVCTLRGAVDVDALRLAWQDVAQQHAALRTEFLWDDVDRPLQVVRSEAAIPVVLFEGTSVDEVARRERERGFDLATAPLCRVALVQDDGAVHLVWTHHHIILDGWSLPLVLRDLFDAYSARARGQAPSFAEPPSYKAYAAWLRAPSRDDGVFARMLEGVSSATPLPCETRSPRSTEHLPHASEACVLPAAEAQKVGAFARRSGATLAGVLAAAWAMLLRRHAGTDDVVFGVTLAGRPTEVARSSELVGMFVNTLPLRVRFEDEPSAQAVLSAVQTGLVVLQENQHRSLADVQRLSAVPPGKPLFESLVVVENYPADAARGAAASLRIEDVRTIERISYPLALVCSPHGGGHEELGLRLLYDPARFDAQAVRAILGRLRVLLGALADGYAGRADAVPIVTPEELRALRDRRSHASTCPVTGSLADLFGARAEKEPDRIAVVHEGERATYRELSARAHAIADALGAHGIGPGARVALALDRSIDLVASVLGILEAGAAYVPLDPAHPAERLRWTTTDSGATALLTTGELDPFGGAAPIPTVHIEDVPQASQRRDRPRARPEDPAYVLYTSGSTGRPKGVVVTHANVVRLFASTDAWFRFAPDDVFTLFHSIAFDFSVWELFGALLHGGRLVVVPRKITRAPDEFRALLSTERVTILNQTPSAFEQLIAADERDGSPLFLRAVVFGGEALAVDRLAPWLARHGDAAPRLVNMYGITETTVHVTYRPIRASDLGVAARRGASPIGRPIPDLTVHVLDATGEPAPLGVPGEIWVGGAGVARGYHDRAELDAARFVVGPSGERLYRSGDLGRFVGDDELEFLGRADAQVKIRGHRIEPGEIEATLLERTDLQGTAVVVREDEGERRLVAYLVPREDVDHGRLVALAREHLASRVPEPMIPSAFVVLDALPLTVNGKLDRARLPAPSVDARPDDHVPRRAPRDPLEEIVTQVWARVLRDEHLGPDDDVFERGAHSLLVTQVASRLRASTGQDVSLRALFEHGTPARLADHVRRLQQGLARPPLIRATAEGDDAPLTFAQQRLWFLDRLGRTTDRAHGARSLWTIPLAARIRGLLDRDALRRALDALVRRHGALRTAFLERDGMPYQRIQPAGEVPFQVVRTSEAALPELAAAEIALPFDLTAPPLLRVTLFELAPDEHVLLLAVHHIAADAWSLALVVRDLAALYAGTELPELPIALTDYGLWQRSWLTGDTLAQELAFFRERLAGAPPLVDLPTDRPRPRLPTYAAGEITFELAPDVARALETRAREAGATLSMVLLAVLHALVARWSGQDDVSIGVSIAGRARAEIEDLVGFFVNLLVVRAKVGPDAPFHELLATVREASLGAYAHQDVPFEQVVDALQPARSLSHSPLFQVNFVYQNVPLAQLWAGAPSAGALELEPVRLAVDTVRFDLVLTLEEPRGGPLRATLSYARDLFDASTAQAFAEQYAALASAIAEDDELLLGAIPLGAAPELPALPARIPLPEVPLHTLVAQRAAAMPDAPAVTQGDRILTYAELVGRAGRLARELRAAGVSRGVRVAIAMGRSPERIVALLAVLAAGGAFVPIEPSLPLDRRARLLERSGAAIALVDEAGEDDLPTFAGHVMLVDEDDAGIAPFDAGVGLDDPAYVLFTSGSTGEPKGVVVGHRGLANLAAAQAEAFGVGTTDRVLSFASFAFDAFVSEVGMALVMGALLDLGEAERAPRDAVLDTLAGRRISVVTLPPTLLRALDPTTRGGLPDLRVLVSAGEALYEATARAWDAPHRRLFNAYGPTETTVCATIHRWERATGEIAEDAPARVPIGLALAHTRLAVLDDDGKPVPRGVVGELHVGGVGVALGYLDAPELTTRAFVGHGAERMYRTGDRVRALASGALEYVGRRDEQVKVRGVRVELGEVEWAIAQHPAVAESAARVVDDRLVGYAVLRAEATRAEILARVKDRVPAAMVPAQLVLLPAMPRTATGKIDRAVLPAPAVDDITAVTAHEPAREGLEATIAALWQRLLQAPRVSRTDDFFALGGHSLVALQVAARLRETTGVEPPIALVFEHPRLEAFARAVGELAGTEADEPLVRIPRHGPLPLSFAEERLWLLEQLQPGTNVYGLAAAFRLTGALDPTRLERAVRAVVERHEILRTTYVHDGGSPRVVVGPAHPESWSTSTLASEHDALAFVERTAGEPFFLDRAPLARFRLGRLASDEHVLVIALHHALADAWSLDIVLADLARAYAGAPLDPITVGYVDFAAWQRRAFESGRRAHLLEAAKARLEGAPLVLELPFDRTSPKVPAARADRERAVIDAATVTAIARIAEGRQATPFMVWLAAFLVTLERWTGTSDLVVGTPAAHRPRAALEAVVGNFLGSLVVRAELGGLSTVDALLDRVRTSALAALGDEDLPFEHLAQALRPPRDLGRNPIFQVLFSMTTAIARGSPALGDVSVRPLTTATSYAKLDLSLGLGPHADGLEAVLEYRTDRFDRETIALVLASFVEVARALGREASLREVHDAATRPWTTTLGRANATDAPGLGVVPFPTRVLEQARARPDAVAVEHEGTSSTYAELVAEALRVAARLRAAGVVPGDAVGITLRRSPRLVATLLGVLLARAAYVPLPAGTPALRIEQMAADARVRLVITDAWIGPETPGSEAPVLDDVAYVLFTSGSTGRPKGVAIEHGALANLLDAFVALLGLAPDDRWLAITPLSFDIAGLELWGPLVAGATVVLASEEDATDGQALARRITQAGPTVLQATPSTYRMLLAASPDIDLRGVRLLSGGEALTSALAGELLARGRELWNVYGPTETTIWSTALRVTPDEVARGGWVSLGTPIANTRIAVVDDDCADRAAGEIHIAGRGLARGYVVADTHGAFVQGTQRTYRTGDRARIRWDGALVFEGRGDGQVKLRGHRIELGEIEAHLEAHPAVAEAVAVVEREGDDAWLVAHVVQDGTTSETDLRAWLRDRVAEPMVPTWFALAPSLPRTPNGKVDRRALPQLALERRTVGAGGTLETDAERRIAALFEEVLGARGVDRDGDFFALGGHSLLATELVARIRTRIGVDVPLRAVFEAPRVAELARRVEASAQAAGSIPRRAAGRAVPSHAQERMWLLARLEPDAATYHLPAAVRIRGPLDTAALAQALVVVVARHAPLHTTFALDPEGLTAVPRAATIELPVEPCPSSELDERLRTLAVEPFDLASDLPIRATLLRLAPDDHVLALVVHHVAADATSLAIVTDEVTSAYDALRRGESPSLPALAIDYFDFAAWQRTRGRDERDLAYWTATLADLDACEVRPDFSRHGRTPEGGLVRTSLAPESGARIGAFARSKQATLFIVALAALDVVLARFAGTLDVRVGTPIGGRTAVELEPLVGPFLETLVLRTSLAGATTVDALVDRARTTALDAFAHASVPFDELVRTLEPERDLTRTPLFQAMLLVHPDPRRAPRSLDALTFEPVDVRARVSAFELTFAVTEQTSGALELALEYRADLFEEATATRLVAALAQVLDALPSGELPHFPAVVLRGPPAPPFVPITTAIPRSDAPAVVGPTSEQVTYDELVDLAQRVAGTLRQRGIAPADVVALELARSPRLVAAILGVWWAGAAWLPLDRAWPEDRKAWIARDAGAAARIDDAGIRVGERFVSWAALDAGIDPTPLSPDDAAYVLYTSGSTGTPKGVEVTHGNLANLALAMRGRFALQPEDRVLQFASITFDASLEEIVPTLLAGATLVLRHDEAPGSLQAFLDDVEAAGITVLDLPTALWHTWVDECPDRVPPAVRLVVVGGEAATLDRLMRFRRGAGSGVTWMNTYGPTEATVTATAFELAPGATCPEHVPIGTPIDGVTARVVGPAGDVVGHGCPGELCIGGAGVARGYVGLPERTRERFVDLDGERLYRTSDLVRLHATGDLEFLGRVDAQLKVRGHRIEPGEIEAALRADARVKDAAIIGHGGALVAYVVTREAALASTLRDALSERLPAALVPTSWVFLEDLPRTTSGKLDRRRLPLPSTRDGRITLPRTPTERTLAAIWSDLLDTEAVSIDDDFFALGGHSLLATQLLSRIRSRMGVDLPLRAIFEASTVAALAMRITRANGAAAGAIARRTGSDAPLSFAQERLFFLDRLEPNSAFYNLPAALTLDGPLDAAALARAIRTVWDRHDVLRSSFADDGGRPRQHIAPPGGLEVPIVSLEHLPVAERERDALREAERDAVVPFDLARGPLVRVRILRLAPDRHVLVATMHHIVADGWSIAVLLREVGQAYAHARLPELPIQYADFAAWQRTRFESGALERGIRFFAESLAGAPPLLELPTDRPRPRVQGFAGDDVGFTLEPELATRLRTYAAARSATPFMVLLATLDVLLGRLAGTKDVLVGASVANRTRAEVEPLLGFFVNIVVLRADLGTARTFDDLVAQVRERTLAALEHEDVPFDRVVDAVAPERSLGHSPIFQVNFVLQNAPVASAGLPGLQLGALPVSGRSARFDLIVTLEEIGERFAGMLTFRTDLFERATAERFAAAYVTLLGSALAEPDRAIDHLPLLDDGARSAAIAQGIGPTTAPRDLVLSRAFEAVSGERVALAHRDATITYAELDARANRLARLLVSFGAGRGVRVAIAAGREPARIVALLAVMKAGASYVPIDERNPPTRVAAMLEDAGVALAVATEDHADRLPAQVPYVVVLEEHEATLAALPSGPLESAPALDDEAYVMFTSGSTGRPKGVRVAHRGILNLAVAQRTAFGVRADDRVLQLASFGFDASLSEIAMALTAGAVLDLGEDDDVPSEGLLTRREITVATIPPSLLARLDLGRVPALRVVISAGEPLPPAIARRCAGRELFNAYGPTEATVCATIHRVEPRDLDGQRIPIGRPIENVVVHVVDDALEPVLPGVAGEIVIGGTGLALGYLDGERARFVESSWAGRLYRTGDRGRWCVDGALEILGRDDAQVKVRGHRIELGEVEHALAGHAAVAQAVAMVRADVAEIPILVAYVVLNDDADEAELKAFVEARLPGYMVPARIVRLPELPTSASGKIDRTALPHPETTEDAARAAPVEARTAAERIVGETWRSVLGRERVNVTDSFFELGGDSILTLQAVARLAERGLTVTAKQIFEEQTVERVAAVARARDERREEIRGDVEEHTPTPLQEGLLFHALYAEGTPVYVSQLACRIDGPLDPERLREAWRVVLRRHSALRTAFVLGPHARVVAEVDVPLTIVDASRADVDRLAQAERARGFDPALAPLFRLLLARVGPEHHELIFTHHHVILDGWSVAIVLDEVVALTLGVDPRTLPPALPFAAYAEWLGRRDLGNADAFFRTMLSGVSAPTPLGLGRDRRQEVTRVRERTRRVASAPLDRALRGRGLTPATLVTAAWAELLGRYARSRDVVVGVTIAGRPAELPGADRAVGLYINTLPVRVTRAKGPAADWLAGVQHTLAELREVGYTPLARAQAQSAVPPKSPLFESIVVFENFPVGSSAPADAPLRVGDIRGAEQTSYPLTVVAAPGPELELRIAYDVERFDEHDIDLLLERLARTIGALASDAPLEAIALDDDGVQDVLRGPACSDPPLLVDGFLDQVRRTPDALAALDVATGERATYAELAARARGFATGIEPGTTIAVALPRSIALLAAILGVAMAGGVFVPLDPTHPSERLRFQIADSGATRVISSPGALDGPHITRRPVARDVAYILYTSGSTGKPKGVVVEHGPLARYLAFAREAYRLGPSDGAVVHTSVAFDLTLTTLLAPLGAGGHVILAPPGDGISPLLGAIETPVALLKMTPGHAALLAAELAGQRRRLARAIVLGGEALSTATVRALAAIDPEATIDNEYGPTEAVVGSVVHRADPASTEPFVPIGRPIPGVELTIVDEELRPVPQGIAGELLIAGPTARGYLGRPEETKARFLDAGYRTGDLVRLRADGVLEYLGREDDQVKVRGHRVELGEVEAALLDDARVREAAVVLTGDGELARLVAYVVATAPVDDLLEHVRKALPAAFVPSRIVAVDALPLAPSGKVDRARLAAIPLAAEHGASSGEPPRGEREEALARIWQKVLARNDVRRDDDFFHAGGNSILALQVIAQTAGLGLRLTPRQIFEHSTLAAMAEIARPLPTAAVVGEDEPVGPIPLTPIQRWFFASGRKHPSHYNQSLLLECRVPVTLALLRDVVGEVFGHHGLLDVRFEPGMLRTGSRRDDVVEQADLTTVPDAELAGAIEARCAEIQASLDLESGRLARVLWLDCGRERPSRLLFVIHHLVVDAVSWRVLLGDLELAWAARARGEPARLPPVPATFGAFARALERWATEGDLRAEAHYWTSLAATPPQTSRARPATHRASAKIANVQGLHERLLIGLARALSHWSGTEHVVDVEGHGREEIPGASLDLSRAVGWFTSLYPVRLRWDPASSIEDNARTVAADLARIPRNGIGYGVLRWLAPDPELQARLAAVRASVSFNYLGQLDGVLDASGPFAPAREGRGREEAPDEPRPHVLEVNAFVAGGELVVEWTYAPDVHEPAVVARMAELLLETVFAVTPRRRPVLLRGGSNAPPLFLVHPVGGLVTCYRELAHALPAGRAIYGLEADGQRTVEAMAERYLDAVRAVVGDGPFVVGGWSMGALVAHAMAADPRRVGPIVALDQTPAEVRRDLDDAALLLEIVGDALPLDLATLRTLSAREQIRFVLEEARRRGHDGALAGLEEEDVRRHVETCKANFRALAAYAPARGEADVLLLRAAVRPVDGDPVAEWQRYTSGRVVVREVPGDHVTMMRSPHVSRLALLMAEALAVS